MGKSIMKIRDIIKKAREQAKTADELLLPDFFEEYLDLLEMKKEAKRSDRAEIDLRLTKSLSSLREVAERVSMSYGMDTAQMFEFFSNPANLDPSFADSLQGVHTIESPKGLSKPKLAKNNKKLRV